MALVGFCGSRDLPPHQRKLVSSVVYAVARAERGIAVGCAQGADAIALRECFTPTWALRAPMVRVFAAFGPNGQGDGEWSATQLVQKISYLPMAMAGGNGGLRVVVNWWAGGDSSVDLITRLKARSDAMVSAVAASGEGQGLVAFVTAGPSQSPGTWRTIRQAYKRGIPVVVFGCRCTLRSFPSLGKGRWVSAGSGVWKRGWRWLSADRAVPRRSGGRHERAEQPEPEPDDEQVGLLEGILSAIFGWEKASPRRRTVELDFPLLSNVRTWLYEQNYPNLITEKEV